LNFFFLILTWDQGLFYELFKILIMHICDITKMILRRDLRWHVHYAQWMTRNHVVALNTRNHFLSYNNHKHFEVHFLYIYIIYMLVRKDMDVNAREVLSNITLGHKLKEQRFYCYSTFHMYMYIHCVYQSKRTGYLYFWSFARRWLSWSWSYGSWIYNYLSPLKLGVQIPLMVRCTRYNFMW